MRTEILVTAAVLAIEASLTEDQRKKVVIVGPGYSGKCLGDTFDDNWGDCTAADIHWDNWTYDYPNFSRMRKAHQRLTLPKHSRSFRTGKRGRRK